MSVPRPFLIKLGIGSTIEEAPIGVAILALVVSTPQSGTSACLDQASK